MSYLDIIDEHYAEIPYMNRARADLVKGIIADNNAKDIIEIGFFHGKSSCYIAAILEERGAGHLTTLDLTKARNKDPNIQDMLAKTGLSHRVTPFFAKRSYTWELQRLISASPRPQFDFCFFDGGHTWDTTGFGVLLIDMLLRPGGLILLDDMDWNIAGSRYYQDNPGKMNPYDKDERNAPAVRRVWETILPHLGYDHVCEYREFELGLARKKIS